MAQLPSGNNTESVSGNGWKSLRAHVQQVNPSTASQYIHESSSWDWCWPDLLGVLLDGGGSHSSPLLEDWRIIRAFTSLSKTPITTFWITAKKVVRLVMCEGFKQLLNIAISWKRLASLWFSVSGWCQLSDIFGLPTVTLSWTVKWTDRSVHSTYLFSQTQSLHFCLHVPPLLCICLHAPGRCVSVQCEWKRMASCPDPWVCLEAPSHPREESQLASTSYSTDLT